MGEWERRGWHGCRMSFGARREPHARPDHGASFRALVTDSRKFVRYCPAHILSHSFCTHANIQAVQLFTDVFSAILNTGAGIILPEERELGTTMACIQVGAMHTFLVEADIRLDLCFTHQSTKISE